MAHSFQKFGLIWCSVDYPKISDLPNSRLLFTQTSGQSEHSELSQHSKNQVTQKRTGYLRMHGNNLNWWNVISASERYDYRYSIEEMQTWAQAIANQRRHFDELYVFFQNSTNAHAYDNIAMLREALLAFEFKII